MRYCLCLLTCQINVQLRFSGQELFLLFSKFAKLLYLPFIFIFHKLLICNCGRKHNITLVLIYLKTRITLISQSLKLDQQDRKHQTTRRLSLVNSYFLINQQLSMMGRLFKNLNKCFTSALLSFFGANLHIQLNVPNSKYGQIQILQRRF